MCMRLVLPIQQFQQLYRMPKERKIKKVLLLSWEGVEVMETSGLNKTIAHTLEWKTYEKKTWIKEKLQRFCLVQSPRQEGLHIEPSELCDLAPKLLVIGE